MRGYKLPASIRNDISLKNWQRKLDCIGTRTQEMMVVLYLAAIFTTSVAPRDARRILCFGLETQQADICVHGQGYGIRLAWPGRARRSRALRSCLTGLLYGPHRHWVTAFAYSLHSSPFYLYIFFFFILFLVCFISFPSIP